MPEPGEGQAKSPSPSKTRFQADYADYADNPMKNA